MQEQDDDSEFDSEGGPGTWARVRGIISTAIGAVVAMALLMALGIWFYRLGVRDAQNVPIIRAAAEPAKVRPEDPGGVETPHQNIESYEAATDEPAQVAAVVIAPEPPEPKPEDVPLGELTPNPPTPAENLVESQSIVPVPTPSPTTTEEVEAQPTNVLPPVKVQTEPAEEEIQTALLESPESPETPETPLVEPESEPEPAVTTGGTEFAPSRSPVAPIRPSNLKQRVAAAAQAVADERDDLAKRAAASSVQIQLAADPNEAAMRALWAKVSKANGDILRGRTLAIQTTVSGGTTFYRLRVGPFRDRAEARNVCAALSARGQDCIVARNS